MYWLQFDASRKIKDDNLLTSEMSSLSHSMYLPGSLCSAVMKWCKFPSICPSNMCISVNMSRLMNCWFHSFGAGSVVHILCMFRLLLSKLPSSCCQIAGGDCCLVSHFLLQWAISHLCCWALGGLQYALRKDVKFHIFPGNTEADSPQPGSEFTGGCPNPSTWSVSTEIREQEVIMQSLLVTVEGVETDLEMEITLVVYFRGKEHLQTYYRRVPRTRLTCCGCSRCWRWHEGIDGFSISLSSQWWPGKEEVFNWVGATSATATHKPSHPFRDFSPRMEDIALKTVTIKHEWALCSELNSSTELLRRPLTIQNKLTSSFWLGSRKYGCGMYSSINVDVLYVTVRRLTVMVVMTHHRAVWE